jgi:RimJ/RimL family protein N-acetyltransferase
MTVIFETERLFIRLAIIDDAEMICALWNDPRIMTNVGFPNGLNITPEKICKDIEKRGADPFKQLLIVEKKADRQAIGQCVMRRPDESGISETDIKLLPAFWGQKYGVEVKRGLLDYPFSHTDCASVQATPNVDNVASIKMQEAVRGIQVGEETFKFPESMRRFTTPVHHYIYRVFREEWEKRRKWSLPELL